MHSQRKSAKTALTRNVRARGHICRELALAVVILAVVSGCRQGVYDATSLPPEFIAVRPPNVQEIDLSRLARASVQNERIYPGDVLDVTIATGMEQEQPLTWPMRTADDGTVNIPLVGNVYVSGMLLEEAELAIQQESIRRDVYRHPHVSVLIKNRRTNRVTVVGAVNEPNVYELPAANSDLLSALVAAGGLNEDAGTIVDVRRPPRSAVQGDITGVEGPDLPDGTTSRFAAMRGEPTPAGQGESIQVDLVEVSQRADGAFAIDDGAVVVVRKRKPSTIHVIGLVNKPDEFELPPDQDVRVLDALAKAGGRTLQVVDKVHVIRIVPGRQEPVVINVSVAKAKRDGRSNIRLAPGDVVSVEETAVSFMVATMRDFLRFGFTTGIPGL